MAVAVVIVTYNSAPEIARALLSLPVGCELVVVDNASMDAHATHAQLTTHAPQAHWLPLRRNVGFGRAVNHGVRQTRAETLLLLNPDACLEGGARQMRLVQLEEALVGSGAAAMGPRVIDERGALQLSMGPWPSLGAEGLRRVVQRRLDGGGIMGQLMRCGLDAIFSRPCKVPWVTGAALVVRREAFARIGGFDPGYFLFFEDIDLCLRLWHAGCAVAYEPRLTVRHARGKSSARAVGLAAQAYRDSQIRSARQYMHPRAARLVARWAHTRRPAGAPR